MLQGSASFNLRYAAFLLFFDCFVNGGKKARKAFVVFNRSSIIFTVQYAGDRRLGSRLHTGDCNEYTDTDLPLKSGHLSGEFFVLHRFCR